MRTRWILGLLVSLCASPAIAESPAGPFYLGVEFGQGRTELGKNPPVITRGTITGTSRDEDDRAFGVYVGYAITPRFGIELAYTDLGETRYTEDRDVPSPTLPFPPPFDDVFFRDAIVPEREQTTIESESLSLSLIGRYPLTEALFVVGRAGITVHRSETNIRFWFNENETTVINGASENSDGAVNLGIGIEWDFHRHWHARLQLQRNFALEDEEFIAQVVRGDVTLLTAGVGYRF